MRIVEPRDRIVVALDVDTRERALALVDELQPFVGLFKIGSQLFTSCGPGLVSEMIGRGARIFLDLKYHDIPNTVANAVVGAMRLGVSICNVHALGGLEMMRRVREACEETAAREAIARPTVLAVTVLTSHDQKTLDQLGFNESLDSLVARLVRLTADAGLDGVVASAREIELVRASVPGQFVILTPGLRPEWAASQDQKRVLTPREALDAGADYLVIGRPILEHPSPAEAAQKILNSFL
jgi:orotidine-5'-phosphate decarboxylase